MNLPNCLSQGKAATPRVNNSHSESYLPEIQLDPGRQKAQSKADQFLKPAVFISPKERNLGVCF